MQKFIIQVHCRPRHTFKNSCLTHVGRHELTLIAQHFWIVFFLPSIDKKNERKERNKSREFAFAVVLKNIMAKSCKKEKKKK